MLVVLVTPLTAPLLPVQHQISIQDLNFRCILSAAGVGQLNKSKSMQRRSVLSTHDSNCGGSVLVALHIMYDMSVNEGLSPAMNAAVSTVSHLQAICRLAAG